MVYHQGEYKIEFSKEELAVLLSMVEGAIGACFDDGDDPSETAWAVCRKVATLYIIGESSVQLVLPHGGDFLDPRVIDVERFQNIMREGRENTTACPLHTR